MSQIPGTLNFLSYGPWVILGWIAKFSEQVLFKNPPKKKHRLCHRYLDPSPLPHEAFTGMALHELRTYADFQALSCEAVTMTRCAPVCFCWFRGDFIDFMRVLPTNNLILPDFTKKNDEQWGFHGILTKKTEDFIEWTCSWNLMESRVKQQNGGMIWYSGGIMGISREQAGKTPILNAHGTEKIIEHHRTK